MSTPIPPGTPTPTTYGAVQAAVEARLQELEALPRLVQDTDGVWYVED